VNLNLGVTNGQGSARGLGIGTTSERSLNERRQINLVMLGTDGNNTFDFSPSN
jgi:hypothetical protein